MSLFVRKVSHAFSAITLKSHNDNDDLWERGHRERAEALRGSITRGASTQSGVTPRQAVRAKWRSSERSRITVQTPDLTLCSSGFHERPTHPVAAQVATPCACVYLCVSGNKRTQQDWIHITQTNFWEPHLKMAVHILSQREPNYPNYVWNDRT